MTEVFIEPASARAVVRLPPSFAAAWSPGFDLHVTGRGATPDHAREDLRRNLRSLGEELLRQADELGPPCPTCGKLADSVYSGGELGDGIRFSCPDGHPWGAEWSS